MTSCDANEQCTCILLHGLNGNVVGLQRNPFCDMHGDHQRRGVLRDSPEARELLQRRNRSEDVLSIRVVEAFEHFYDCWHKGAGDASEARRAAFVVMWEWKKGMGR